jgi:hypothetical protein
MFSYTINNPNNFIIDSNNYHIVPIGFRCSTAIACKYANIRKFSLPFDWGIPWYPKTIHQIIESNFENFYDFKAPNDRAIFNTKYGFGSGHFNKNINELVETMKKRVDRLNNIIIEQNKKIYFIHISEDYFYDEKHREDSFNDMILKQLLELEILLKTKYIHLNFNIIYINFRQETIPENSNIINIVLHSSKLYEKSQGAPFESLRKYCGKILSELFNSKYCDNPINYSDNNVYNN